MIQKVILTFGLEFVLLLVLSGCTTGLIYTHTVRPLDVNHHLSPIVQGSEKSDIRYLHIPLTGQYRLDFLWNSSAIGDIAKKNGLETVYYADVEMFSILSIWNQYTVHVYGK